MAARAAVTRQVKPLLSGDSLDAKVRVLSLYKAWYRHIPFMVKDFHFPRDVDQCRDVLRWEWWEKPIPRISQLSHCRKEFRSKAAVKDIRVIDMLVVKVNSTTIIWPNILQIFYFRVNRTWKKLWNTGSRIITSWTSGSGMMLLRRNPKTLFQSSLTVTNN